MATDLIVTLNGKELKAKPITLGDWKFLGQYLKSRLLDDLSLVDNKTLRRELQMEIQNRDYDASDVVNCRRRDVMLKVWYVIFGGNIGMTEAGIKDLMNDDHIFEIIRQVYEASGITFVKVESEDSDSDAENPTSESQQTDE
jgi:hypothetical protein